MDKFIKGTTEFLKLDKESIEIILFFFFLGLIAFAFTGKLAWIPTLLFPYFFYEFYTRSEQKIGTILLEWILTITFIVFLIFQ